MIVSAEAVCGAAAGGSGVMSVDVRTSYSSSELTPNICIANDDG